MALIINPRVLLLDEPMAGLSSAESQTIKGLIKELNSEITILIIEHDMDVAFEVASSITVLNSGQVFFEGTKDEVKGNKGVQEIYLGDE